MYAHVEVPTQPVDTSLPILQFAAGTARNQSGRACLHGFDGEKLVALKNF
jgi:hypothetical protein